MLKIHIVRTNGCNSSSYLFLCSKNHIHEIHVLLGTVLRRFYHLSGNNVNMSSKLINNNNFKNSHEANLTNILDLMSCPTEATNQQITMKWGKK